MICCACCACCCSLCCFLHHLLTTLEPVAASLPAWQCEQIKQILIIIAHLRCTQNSSVTSSQSFCWAASVFPKCLSMAERGFSGLSQIHSCSDRQTTAGAASNMLCVLLVYPGHLTCQQLDARYCELAAYHYAVTLFFPCTSSSPIVSIGKEG